MKLFHNSLQFKHWFERQDLAGQICKNLGIFASQFDNTVIRA